MSFHFRPEMILCGCQDVKIQELTNKLIYYLQIRWFEAFVTTHSHPIDVLDD